MLLEQTLSKLNQMKLHGMARSLKERLSRPDHGELGVSDLFGLIVDDEWLARENRRLSSRIKQAHFREKNACVEDWDSQTTRGLAKSNFLEFTKNDWLKSHQNIIITGPCGSGKSYLAQALANNACRNGFSALYFWLPRFSQLIAKSKAEGSLPNLLRRIAKADLVILDDWGLVALPEMDRHAVLEIIEDRYGLGSTMITSQLEVADWHDYLGAGNLADGVCDRLIHNAHRIELLGVDSMRKTKHGLTGKTDCVKDK
jgi:DNA replication protein DnaC